jgi:Fur family iron response transcriptional regulator
MLKDQKLQTKEWVNALLREHGINATAQRVEIAHALFCRGRHLSAEDLYDIVNRDRPQVSKATVYNTLGLFVEKGLIREVIADPSKTFYDPNTAPHHHFYDVTTGELMDIDGDDVAISGLPPLPADTELEGVDVIVRLRHTTAY